MNQQRNYPAQELQKAIYQALSEIESVDVFDEIPDNANFPYIVIGDDTVNDDSTKTEYGYDVTAAVHVFSRYEGYKELKEIMGSVIRALELSGLEMTGFNVYRKWVIYADHYRESDGRTRHGVIRFRFNIQQITTIGG